MVMIQLSKKLKFAGIDACIPEEIIEDILLRLPVKSLLRFRCVSKTWSSLVSSNKFIKTHLQMSRTFLAFPSYIPVSYQGERSRRLVYCSLHLRSPLPLFYGTRDTDTILLKLDNPFDDCYNCLTTRIQGYSNGLCCMVYHRKYIIFFNPSTKKLYRLPKISDNKYWRFYNNDVSFGFDETSDDYKVLAHILDGEERRKTFRLYSLRENSWKTVECFCDKTWQSWLISEGGVCVSGKFHWVIKQEIISFDLKSESGGSVQRPASVHCDYLCPQLSWLKGGLCMVSDNPESGKDIWVMKTYGVKESWTKIVTIPVTYPLYNNFPVAVRDVRSMIMPLCTSPDGEILLTQNSILTIYNPKTNTFRHPRQIKQFSTEQDLTGFYQKSLVSPFPNGLELHQQLDPHMAITPILWNARYKWGIYLYT